MGLLVLTLSGMLLLRPAWALSICFQLSAAASPGLTPMAVALLVYVLVQLGNGLVVVERFGRHLLLARHRWRAALVSTLGDARSCQM